MKLKRDCYASLFPSLRTCRNFRQVELSTSSSFSLTYQCSGFRESEEAPPYVSGKITRISDEEFKELLGHEIPDGRWSGTLQTNDAICQPYYAKSLKARLVYKILTGMLNKSIAKREPDLNIIFYL